MHQLLSLGLVINNTLNTGLVQMFIVPHRQRLVHLDLRSDVIVP